MIKSTLIALATTALLSASAPLSVAAPGGKKTLGYVVTLWNTAIYESRFAEECPEGLVVGNDEIWWRALSRDDKDKFTNGGLKQPVDRKGTANYRAPGGKDVCWNPETVKDPPLRTVRGKTGFGFDLDNNVDGNGTAKSCKHETFTSPDGVKGVDNQIYRVLGCHYGWRRNGVMENYDDEERRNSGRGVVLIEINNIDDLKNDDDVELRLYRAIDPFQIDAAGKILPYGSYRIDMDGKTPRYGVPLKAKIANGVLTTESKDFSVPWYGNATYAEIRLRDGRLTLDLNTPEINATGLLGGYYDLDKFMEYLNKIQFLVATGDWNCPSLFEATKKMADGYPDKDGNCTAISSAFQVEAIPAFIVHRVQSAQAK